MAASRRHIATYKDALKHIATLLVDVPPESLTEPYRALQGLSRRFYIITKVMDKLFSSLLGSAARARPAG